MEVVQQSTAGSHRWYGLNSNHFLQQGMQADFRVICIFVDKSVLNKMVHIREVIMPHPVLKAILILRQLAAGRDYAECSIADWIIC